MPVNVSVKTNPGQFGSEERWARPADSRGLSNVSCYFIGDCSRSRIKQTISVIQDEPQDRTKRSGRLRLLAAELQAARHLSVDLAARWRLKQRLLLKSKGTLAT